MDCPFCLQETDTGVRYCGNCGHDLSLNARRYVPDQPERVQVAAAVFGPAAAPARSRAAFMLGLAGLAGWLVPAVGLALGVAAIAVGTMALKQLHRSLAVAGIVLGAVTLVLSLMALAYAADSTRAAYGDYQPGNVSRSALDGYGIETPCFRLALPISLQMTSEDSGGCSFAAADPKTFDEYAVHGQYKPSLTAATLPAAARADVAEFLADRPDSRLVSAAAGTFAGSTAEHFEVAMGHLRGRIVYVYKPAPKGHNVFVVARFSTTDPSLSTVEAGWEWK